MIQDFILDRYYGSTYDSGELESYVRDDYFSFLDNSYSMYEEFGGELHKALCKNDNARLQTLLCEYFQDLDEYKPEFRDRICDFIKSRLWTTPHFFAPCGGCEFYRFQSVVDYFFYTNFSYAVSCLELPSFRCLLVKDDDGYTLIMLDKSDNDRGETRIPMGKRMTMKKWKFLRDQMNGYVNQMEVAA